MARRVSRNRRPPSYALEGGQAGGPEYTEQDDEQPVRSVMDRGPEFEEAGQASQAAPDQEEGRGAVAVPTRAEAKKSPWPSRIAGIVTALAILAILLAIFMPKERPETQRQAGVVTPDPSPSTMPTPRPRRAAASLSVAQPRPMEPSPQPSPQPAPSDEAPAPQPEAGEHWGTCPTCGGSGEVACPFPASWHDKNGHLIAPEGVMLPDDGDFGTELRKDLTGSLCPFCGGSLKMKCLRCGGTGKIKVDENGKPADNFDQALPSLGLLKNMGGQQR